MSAILKAGARPAGPIQPSSFHLRDLLGEAEEVVRQARRDAAALLARTRGEARALREQARQAGHAEGLREGRTAGERAGRQSAYEEASQRFAEDQRQLVDSLSGLIEQVSGERLQRLHAAEAELLDFALAVARRVARGIGSLEPDVARANLQAALQRVVRHSDIVVHAHPQDCAALEQFAGEVAGQLAQRPHIRLVPDEGVGRGGVRLQAAETAVDATLDGQLDMICSALVDSRKPRA